MFWGVVDWQQHQHSRNKFNLEIFCCHAGSQHCCISTECRAHYNMNTYVNTFLSQHSAFTETNFHLLSNIKLAGAGYKGSFIARYDMICREATFTITRSHPESHDEMTVRESESQCDCWAAQLYKHWATTGSQSGLPAFSALSWKCARLAQHFLLSFYSLIIVFIMINWVLSCNISKHQLSSVHLVVTREPRETQASLWPGFICRKHSPVTDCDCALCPGRSFCPHILTWPSLLTQIVKILLSDVWCVMCVLYLLYCHDISNTFSILTG